MSKARINILIIVGIISVIGILVAILVFYKPSPKVPTFTPTVRQPNLKVSSQVLVGNELTIDSLYLDKPGYLVIHKNIEGKPGPVIGKSDLISGEKINFKIIIDASQAGTKVFPMLHYDDDSDGIYGFPDEDKPVTLEGNVLVKPIEIIQPTIPPLTSQTKEFTIEADDVGFYLNNQEISSISVSKGERVKITFNVRSQGVYYGGLDFKGCEQNTGSTKPGDSASIQFTADNTCTITSYWPASGVVKDTMQVIVSQ